ncbi:MAG: FAD-binding oxidoreductase [Rhodocyclaceae bacterium]|nr:FAD-binding oxidoreductase [Rhodocyclaceae bacterium]
MSPGLIAALGRVVGEAHVLTAPEDTAPYFNDWRGRYGGQGLCVVRPGQASEVADVVRLCAEVGVAIVPQGGNTGLCGGATPRGGEVLVSLARLNRVRALDPENNTITVEAGCTLAQVQEAAAAQGRLFPLSLAAEGTATIGGNLSTNAGGVQVLRYGNARELTLGLEVVLPDGRLWDGLRGLRKDNTGYDLKHLFIGAEGTLGLITAAVLKLFPRPRHEVTAWVAVPSPLEAVALLGRLRAAMGERVSAFEIVGGMAFELVRKHIPNCIAPFQKPHAWQVLIQVDDGQDVGLDTALESILASAMDDGEVLDAVFAKSESQAAALWGLRENVSEAQKIDGISIKHDVAVPVSSIAEFIARADAALEREFPGIRIVCFGHIGDGNLHYNLSKAARQDNESFIALTPQVNRMVHDLVNELCGSISAEHGLGQLKREEVKRYKSCVELDLMRSIKQAIDPRGLMNPGKVL